MSPTVSLTFLSMLLGGWRVEDAQLVPSEWVTDSATPINDQAFAVLAERRPTPGTDASVPDDQALFVTRPGQPPHLLRRFSRAESPEVGPGSGFTLVVGDEYFRVRLEPTPALISLGRPAVQPWAVTCDDAVHDCVLLAAETGEIHRWRDGTLTRLYTPGLVEDGEPLVPMRATMHPDGGLVALAAGTSAIILSLESGNVTAISGSLTVSRPSFAALAHDLETKPSFRRRWGQRSALCQAAPLGWHGEMPVVRVAEPTEMTELCPVKPREFELDLRTHTRRALPDYPWQVLDCPRGGWTSLAGTLITDCTEADEAMSIRLMKPFRAAGQNPIRELPEGLALSATQLFVIELEPAHAYRWYRGSPKGQGLPFVVDGPSVVTFGPRGVTVEQVPWRFGAASFVTPMADDWHLLESRSLGLALVRLTHDS